MMMWGPYGWGGMGVWGWIWMLINALIWIGILAGIVALVVRLLQQPAAKPRVEAPLDILKRRYATGEISKEEFERMKAEIKD